MTAVIILIFFYFAGVKALFDGLAAIADGTDVIRTAVKTVYTSTKALLAGTEILSININSTYKTMETTSKYLEAEVIELKDLFAGVQTMSPTEISRFIGELGMSSDLDIELLTEKISHLRTLSIYLEGVYSGHETIQAGMELTSKTNQSLLESVDLLSEQVKDEFKYVEAFSEAEKVIGVDKEEAFRILSSDVNVLSEILDSLNSLNDLIHADFNLIIQGILSVNEFMQKALEDFKIVFEVLESFLSLPLTALNSR